jgi:hypothetical protein
VCLAVEDGHASRAEDLGDFVGLARLEVVVPENGDDRQARRRDLLRERVRLVGQPVIGEVAAQQENVGLRARLGEHRLQVPRRALRAVDVGHGRDAHPLT